MKSSAMVSKDDFMTDMEAVGIGDAGQQSSLMQYCEACLPIHASTGSCVDRVDTAVLKRMFTLCGKTRDGEVHTKVTCVNPLTSEITEFYCQSL